MRVLKRLLPGLLSLVLLCGCSGQTEYASGEVKIRDTSTLGKKTTYNLVTIEPTEVGRTLDLSVSQSWQYTKSVSSGSSQYRLKELRVSRNQYVEAGQVIAVLQGLGSQSDAELKELEIASYRSGVTEMLEYYKAQVTAAKALPQETASQQNTRRLKIEYAELELEKYQLQSDYTLKNMEATLTALQEAAGEKELVAPISGTVHSICRYEEGQIMEANTSVCTIYGAEGMRFVGLSSSGCFVYGREMTITLGRSSRSKTFTARVVSSPEVSAPSYNNTMIILEIDATDDELPATDGSATVSYTVLSDVFAVPKNALKSQDGVSYVDILEGDTVCRRSVVKGPQAGSTVSILQGVKLGDQVVLSSYNS